MTQSLYSLWAHANVPFSNAPLHVFQITSGPMSLLRSAFFHYITSSNTRCAAQWHSTIEWVAATLSTLCYFCTASPFLPFMTSLTWHISTFMVSMSPQPSLHLTCRPPSSLPVLLCACQKMTEQNLMLSAQWVSDKQAVTFILFLSVHL